MKVVILSFIYGVCILFSQAQNVLLLAYTNEQNQHHLEWVVTECSYVSHFEIERSTDNSRFEVVYTKEINSYDCNGNYTYTIKNFPKAYKYEYRIKAYLNTALPVLSGNIYYFLSARGC